MIFVGLIESFSFVRFKSGVVARDWARVGAVPPSPTDFPLSVLVSKAVMWRATTGVIRAEGLLAPVWWGLVDRSGESSLETELAGFLLIL